MGRLHDQLKAAGYDGPDLEVFLVRLLFCILAIDGERVDDRGLMLQAVFSGMLQVGKRKFVRLTLV